MDKYTRRLIGFAGRLRSRCRQRVTCTVNQGSVELRWVLRNTRVELRICENSGIARYQCDWLVNTAGFQASWCLYLPDIFSCLPVPRCQPSLMLGEDMCP